MKHLIRILLTLALAATVAFTQEVYDDFESHTPDTPSASIALAGESGVIMTNYSNATAVGSSAAAYLFVGDDGGWAHAGTNYLVLSNAIAVDMFAWYSLQNADYATPLFTGTNDADASN